ncbi:MAG: Ku protein [Bdellovibrio sp.]
MAKKRIAKKREPTSSPRGLWSGHISFGLINIPVQLISAREQKDIHFSMIDPKNLSPIGYKYYNKKTGKEVSHGKTVKAYEYKKGSYVVMTPADFKKANPRATQTIDIENFVELQEIDPVFFERAYYLQARKGGEKAYNLLCEALEKTGKVAIAKIVLHNKQHLVALIARGSSLLLELLHFAENVKELHELNKAKSNGSKKTSSRELQMAERLIDDMTAPWKPDSYRDTYRADILKLVQAKVKAGKATEIAPLREKKDPEETTPVFDLMPLLKKSLESKKRTARGRRASLH